MAAPRKRRVAFEDAVERHAGEEALGRVVQDGKVLGAQVLAAPEPVLGPGQAVVVERLGQELASPDVEHEGHPGLGQAGPDRVEVDVGGREVPGCVRGHPERGHSRLERLLQGAHGPAGIVEGQIADGLEPGVRSAEGDHGPVEGLGPAVEQFGILAPGEMGQGEGGEDELGVYLEGIEHP